VTDYVTVVAGGRHGRRGCGQCGEMLWRGQKRVARGIEESTMRYLTRCRWFCAGTIAKIDRLGMSELGYVVSESISDLRW
jgi:hypothetical protein